MDYLNKEEINRAKMCLANIEDKMNAIETEICSEGNSYKNYLLEKLESVQWDINCLINMCKKEEENK